ncbi:MAG: metallophosphoesterase [Candidatus Kerfeldbacteria bacterium]|nr:metallophosphoesterase [Candidatus Kerfeldbacteria bacterium]
MILAVLVLLMLVQPALADTTITTAGCFVSANEGLRYSVRLQTPTCTITLTNPNSASQTVAVTLTNLDPDFVEVSTYDADPGITTTKNTLSFNITVDSGDTTVTIAPWLAAQDDWYFVALSDNQAIGTVESNPVFEQLIEQVNTVNPVFFTNAGDLVQGSDDGNTLLTMYQSLDDTLTEAWPPMYTVPGNHDSVTVANHYSSYFGDLDYTFTYNGVQFIAMSTSGTTSRGAITDSQFDWLEDNVSIADLPTITLFHHPVAVPSWGVDTCCIEDSLDQQQLALLLDRYQVDLAIVGHSQGYDYRLLTSLDVPTITTGFRQLISGGAGGNIAQPDGGYHFTLMHVTPEGITPTEIRKSSFSTVVEYDDNTAVVENSGSVDLPYLRLKFTMDDKFASYVVSDDAGQYYNTVTSHPFDDYTVVYVVTSAAANTTTTYTVTPATTIHRDTVNTVNTTGEVSYATYPSSTATAVTDFQVTPVKKTTQISAVIWGEADQNYQRSWTEQPATANLDTNYQLAGFPVQRIVDITVNGSYFTTVASDTAGQIEFSYIAKQSDRNFTVTLRPAENQSDIIVIPASSGGPQLRRFDRFGNTVASWFAFSSADRGSYQLNRANVVAADQSAVIVSTAPGTNSQLGIYTITGDTIAELKPFGATATTGVSVATGDVTGDGLDDIAVSPTEHTGLLKIYRYATHSKKLKLVSQRSIIKQANQPLVIADIDGIAPAELITIQPTTGRDRLLVYQLRHGRLRRTASFSMNDGQHSTALVAGRFSAPEAVQLAAYTTTAHGHQLQLYRYSNNRLRLIGATPAVSVTGQPQLLASHIPGSTRDSVLSWSDTTSQLRLYRANSTGEWSLLDQFAPFGNSVAGLAVGTIPREHNSWQHDIIITPLAGGNTVSLWRYQKVKTNWQQQRQWAAFADSFSGGVQVW